MKNLNLQDKQLEQEILRGYKEYQAFGGKLDFTAWQEQLELQNEHPVMSKKDNHKEMERMRETLRSVGTGSFIGGGIEVYHVYPLNDLREHNTDGAECWCNPQHDGDMIIHNSMDCREEFEQGRKPS